MASVEIEKQKNQNYKGDKANHTSEQGFVRVNAKSKRNDPYDIAYNPYHVQGVQSHVYLVRRAVFAAQMLADIEHRKARYKALLLADCFCSFTARAAFAVETANEHIENDFAQQAYCVAPVKGIRQN